MQMRLEDVLREKERELKLHQRFLDLRNYCEEKIFPLCGLPLKEHVETVKGIAEKLIPDPRDRTEELFSGEIFTLLGTIYLHDLDVVKSYQSDLRHGFIGAVSNDQKGLMRNYEIGKSLDIPEMAMEIINHITFSKLVKSMPVEWEISEDSRKAIIRNTKLISHIFNFAHALYDIFYVDLVSKSLRRLKHLNFILRRSDILVDIDSREGIIHVKYTTRFPYELHFLEQAKEYIETNFRVFKDNVNGRLGFQYKHIDWEVLSDMDHNRDGLEAAKFTPYSESESPPVGRWDETSALLDRLFTFGHAIVVGGLSTGKTTVLRSFVIPQMLAVTANVFYVEVWIHPIDELADVICRKKGIDVQTRPDITSLCKTMIQSNPCVFVIDNCERFSDIDGLEREKFQRFVNFCLNEENLYLLVSGDKNSFLEWYSVFDAMEMASIYEVKPLDRIKVLDTLGGGRVDGNGGEPLRPIEVELLKANTSIEDILEGMLAEVTHKRPFRSVVAAIADRDERDLKRYNLADIGFKTALQPEDIVKYLAILKKHDIVQETESAGVRFYSLSSRYLKEHLRDLYVLAEFDEKKVIRNILQNGLVDNTLLNEDSLALIVKWKDEMSFNRGEMGLILASSVYLSAAGDVLLEKAKADSRGVDIERLLKLLDEDDARIRAEAVRLLAEIQDRDMINPLLLHLKRESESGIKDMLVRGIGLTGKKGAMLAIMRTLKEIGDLEARLRAVELFVSLSGKNAEELLVEIRDKEEDPLVLRKIESLLAQVRETVSDPACRVEGLQEP
jgi:hypothetical protein